MSSVDELAERLAGLRGERATVEAAMTKEDLARNVDQWLETARAQAAGASRLVLGGSNASGEHLERVLHEDELDSDGLAARIVARLERQDFGQLSDRQKGSKLKALDEKIAAATIGLREGRKREALEEVERQFAGEAA